jgi:acetylserotonin N-methyltransferase
MARLRYDDTMAEDITIPDPSVVLELMTAFRGSKVMFAAVSLGVFDALLDGPKTAAALGEELGANPDSLARLLDVCVGLQLLTRVGQAYLPARGDSTSSAADKNVCPTYANTPAATAYLTKSSRRRLTGYVNYSNNFMWRLWANLDDAVREGTHRWKQAYGWDGPIFANFFRDEEAKREFLMGMHGFGVISSPHVVAAFDLGPFRRFVDLGGATGHLAIAACRRWGQLEAVVFDLPEAIPLAQEIVGQSPVADRIAIVGGDFFFDPLPVGDLFAVGRILHDWSEEKIHKLLARIYERLPVGGALLIAEKLLDDEKDGPRWAQLQDLNMLTCTEGRERTLGEYESLLRRAGFTEITGCRTASPLDAVLAVKSSA